MLTLESRVWLAPGARLRHDVVRKRWVLLGPERLLVLDGMMQLILERIGEQQTIDALCNGLASEFDAPLEKIQTDVLVLFAGMSERGFLRYA